MLQLEILPTVLLRKQGQIFQKTVKVTTDVRRLPRVTTRILVFENNILKCNFKYTIYSRI